MLEARKVNTFFNRPTPTSRRKSRDRLSKEGNNGIHFLVSNILITYIYF